MSKAEEPDLRQQQTSKPGMSTSSAGDENAVSKPAEKQLLNPAAIVKSR
jgi:hypothetical protein